MSGTLGLMMEVVLGGCLMNDWFIKHNGPGVHTADFLLKGHGFGLAGLMVLKGIVFGLFLPFFSTIWF